METQAQERSFELRSEKVRSIVGQIPSSLVRYGTAVIGLVLAVLLAVFYFLPYRKVYSGSAVIPGSTSPPSETPTRLWSWTKGRL